MGERKFQIVPILPHRHIEYTHRARKGTSLIRYWLLVNPSLAGLSDLYNRNPNPYCLNP